MSSVELLPLVDTDQANALLSESVVLPGADSMRFQTLDAQVESLSEVFCASVYEVVDHLVTNDRGMDSILPAVREHMRQRPSGGMGIFIGSAGLISLLPDLRLDLPVSLDINTPVLEFNSRLGQVILAEGDVLGQLDDQSSVCRYVAQILSKEGTHTDIPNLGYEATFLEDTILSEAKRFGSEHWSNPDRVKTVANALREKDVAYVAADITNRGFVTALSAICRQQDKLITFANLTNVHEWINKSDMSFLRALPFDSNVLIMYSTDEGTPLEAKLAYSLEEYIQVANASLARFADGKDWSQDRVPDYPPNA